MPSAQWASSVLGYSSQNGTTSYAATQALGAPNTNVYGDQPTAWAPSAMNGTQEWLSVGFATSVNATGVKVRETNGNGFVTKIDLLDTGGAWHTVWTGTDSTAPGLNDFSVNFAATSYLVNGVKVFVNTNQNMATREQIDAVQLLDSAASGPTVTGLSPSSGPKTGGTSVVITGTNFTGATQVTFGGMVGTGLVVNSATQITVTTPAFGTAGAVNVVVATPGGNSSGGPQFTYTASAPSVTGLSPSSGSTAGGTQVVITGSNFTGATQVTFGGTAGTGLVVNSATQITVTAPAFGTAGAVNVVVTTPGGNSTGGPQFTYTAAAPSVTGLSPSSGLTAGGTQVVITGSNFAGATQVTFGGIAATFVVNSSTQITATAPAATQAGMVDVRVTSAGGTSAISPSDQFTYFVPAPTVTGISPTSGSTAGGTSVVITGSNFTGATQVTFGGISATFVINSASQITATAPAANAGVVDVRVTTAGGISAISASDQFTYAVPAPTVTGISPASGPTTGGTTVIITGTNFSGTTGVTFGGTSATFTISSATQITATAPAAALAGIVDVQVTTAGGTSATSQVTLFTYTVPAPSVTGITPASGPTSGGTSVVITGSYFSNATGVTFGGVNATYSIDSDTRITATAPASTVAGMLDVRVTTASGTSSVAPAAKFNYILVPPTVTGLSPTSGLTTGGTTVVITGTDFTSVTQVTFGGITASFVIDSNSQITATAPASPMAGPVDVRVTSAGGTSAISSAAQFTYQFPAPTASGLSASWGWTSGGTVVTISGSNLMGVSQVLFGNTAASFVINSATEIMATAPGHAAGVVDVTISGPGGSAIAGQFAYLPPPPMVVDPFANNATSPPMMLPGGTGQESTAWATAFLFGSFSTGAVPTVPMFFGPTLPASSSNSWSTHTSNTDANGTTTTVDNSGSQSVSISDSSAAGGGTITFVSSYSATTLTVIVDANGNTATYDDSSGFNYTFGYTWTAGTGGSIAADYTVDVSASSSRTYDRDGNYATDSTSEASWYTGDTSRSETGSNDWSYSYDADYSLANGAWQLTSGSGSASADGSADSSYVGSGDYGYTLTGGSVTGNWSNSGSEYSEYSLAGTASLGSAGAWTVSKSLESLGSQDWGSSYSGNGSYSINSSDSAAANWTSGTGSITESGSQQGNSDHQAEYTLFANAWQAVSGTGSATMQKRYPVAIGNFWIELKQQHVLDF